jgi:4-alpha-glucanotransferase
MTDPTPRKRTAGVLIHPTSLPGVHGVGELGDHVIEFLDWAASAGQKLWQVLPLNPPGYGASPYGSLSSFAGNWLMISPQRLMQDGLLDPADMPEVPEFAEDHVEFDRANRYKQSILRVAWRHFRKNPSQELQGQFDSFCKAPEQRDWLDDYALFMAAKESRGGAPWWEWGEGLASHSPPALQAARKKFAEEVSYWQFVQFLFFRQWHIVREAARERGIAIMGDIPIYVASDSADVWANRELFHLDERGLPRVVAGVPPDYFSSTGQRWGNPLYRWDVMRENGYRWWVARVRNNLALADLVRLDHFRGFAEYWEIPALEPTAVRGRWMPGPGVDLFNTLREKLGALPLVAEDLGFITPDVHELRRAIGAPGMRILQFAFGEGNSPHIPHMLEPHTVIYTGTHDNDTARGWFDHASPAERDNAMTHMGFTSPDEAAWAMIRTAYTSIAETAIVPLQDILGLGSEARMNTPGADKHNWSWRLRAGALTREHAERLRKLAMVSGR